MSEVGVRPRTSLTVRRPRRLRAPGHAGSAMLAAPALLAYGFAVLVPLALAVYYSLTDYNLLTSTGPFVGLDNYATVLTDRAFWSAFGFTIVLTLVSIVVANTGGVALAMLLNRPRRTFNALRTIAFIPSVLSGVVLAYIWSTILTDQGVLNTLLRDLGLGSLTSSWLGTQLGAQVSVIAVSTWPAIGFATVMYLAGLQAIPRELLEAAAVDGATPGRTFRAVTWPLLRPALFVTTTMMTIGGIKSYDISVVLTGGGPARATDTPAFQILRRGLNENQAGIANAEAIVLLLTLVIVSIAGYFLGDRERQP